MLKRIFLALILPTLLVAIPVVLYLFHGRGMGESIFHGDDTDTIVIITSHQDTIIHEFERKFCAYYKEKTGRNLYIDWRDLGGSSSITRFVNSSFNAEFRRAWEDAGHKCTDEDLKAFCSDKSNSPARDFFMHSDIGIGIDVIFGGGTYDAIDLAKKGFAVDGGVKSRHPEYFQKIPISFGGEQIYDEQGRFYGACLSTFGIGLNTDRMKDAGLQEPEFWADLGEEEYFAKIAIGDPSKSGSIMRCYEMILQARMFQTGPQKGWEDGWADLKFIAANARYVTDGASTLIHDIGSGTVMGGMCIDYYAFSEADWTRRSTGASRVKFILPKGGATVSADIVQVLRGAPNRKVAEMFLDFLLSPEGQKIWEFKTGVPGGPVKGNIFRKSVWMDFADLYPREYYCSPDYKPYQMTGNFVYHAEWTGRYFNLLRVMMKCLLIDPVDDLRDARAAIIAHGGAEKNPAAMAELLAMPCSFDELPEVAKKFKAASVAEKTEMRRQWMEFALAHYRNAKRLAEEGGTK